jgi:hypothetical protein
MLNHPKPKSKQDLIKFKVIFIPYYLSKGWYLFDHVDKTNKNIVLNNSKQKASNIGY